MFVPKVRDDKINPDGFLGNVRNQLDSVLQLAPSTLCKARRSTVAAGRDRQQSSYQQHVVLWGFLKSCSGQCQSCRIILPEARGFLGTALNPATTALVTI